MTGDHALWKGRVGNGIGVKAETIEMAVKITNTEKRTIAKIFIFIGSPLIKLVNLT